MVRIKIIIGCNYKYIGSVVVKNKVSFVVKFVDMKVNIGWKFSIVGVKMLEKMMYFCVNIMFKFYWL